MWKYFKIELERAFKNKLFYGTILLEVALIAAHVCTSVLPEAQNGIPFLLEQLKTAPEKVEMIPNVLSLWVTIDNNIFRTLFFSIMPILSAIPYGAVLYLDMKNHYINQLAVRGNKNHIYGAKMLTLFLSGGVIAVFPHLLSLLANALFVPYLKPYSSTFGFSVTLTKVFGDLFYTHTWVYILLTLLWIFIGYGLLNCLCFAAAFAFENRFIVMLMPFTLYFATYVIGHLIGTVVVPWFYLRVDNFAVGDVPVVIVQMLLYCLLIAAVYLFRARPKRDML